MRKRPTVLDLFAGCGGMSLGLEAAGFDIACSVEFDPVHSLVHHYNFPYAVTMCRDVSSVSGKEVLTKIKEKGFEGIDIVVGGPPCQGFSHIGKRQLDDDRNRLVFEYVRLVKELSPKYFVFENVPGIASGEHKEFLRELLIQFEELGYSVANPYKVLDASHYGVAQARKRLILIGSRKDQKPVTYPHPTHGKLNQGPSLFDSEVHPIVGAGDAIRDLEDVNVFTDHDEGVEPCFDYSSYSSNFRLNPSGVFKNCHIRDVEKKIFNHIGSRHSEESINRFLQADMGTTERISRFYKLHPEKPCNTLRAGTNSDHGAHTAPRPIHYKHPRCISVREGARLHSFPDWFQFHRKIWHGFREIGNAVAPLLAKSLGNELISGLGVRNDESAIYSLGKQDEKLLKLSMTEAANYWNVDRNVIPVRNRVVNE